jgi:hypothetical protein
MRNGDPDRAEEEVDPSRQNSDDRFRTALEGDMNSFESRLRAASRDIGKAGQRPLVEEL